MTVSIQTSTPVGHSAHKTGTLSPREQAVLRDIEGGRLWNFVRTPKAFELRPPLDAHESLTATSFQASFH